MVNLEQFLTGSDLRSIGNSNKVVAWVDNQVVFDELFKLLFHHDRKVVMRSADAIEKITLKRTGFLDTHKKEILALSKMAKDKELIWHLALLLPRIKLSEKEFNTTWALLSGWLTDKTQSKIVRVNSLTSLYNLCNQNKEYKPVLDKMIIQLKKENIPSLNARIKLLHNERSG